MSSSDIRAGVVIHPNKIRICTFCGSRKYLDWLELIWLVLGLRLLDLIVPNKIRKHSILVIHTKRILIKQYAFGFSWVSPWMQYLHLLCFTCIAGNYTRCENWQNGMHPCANSSSFYVLATTPSFSWKDCSC